MPLEYRQGSVFDAEHEVQTLVNTVNTKGVMGKGLALQFKKRYPDMFRDYRARCQRGEVKIGEPYLYALQHPWVLNFPTKKHWRYKSRLEWIERGLEYFVRNYKRWGIKSIAFPQLGTLNGGLQWDDVRPIMERFLGNLDIPVIIYIYAPRGQKGSQGNGKAPQQERTRVHSSTAMTAALDWLRSASRDELDEMGRILKLPDACIDGIVERRRLTDGLRSFADLSSIRGVGERRAEAIVTYADQARSAACQLSLPLQ